MATREIKTSLKIDGEKEFKKALSSVNSGLKTLKSDMAATTSEFKSQANGIEALTAKQKILKAQYDQQDEKVKALNKAYKEAKEVYGENSQKADEYKQKLNYAKVALSDLDGELKKNDKYLDEAKKSTDKCAKSIDEFGNETEKAEKKTSKFGEIFKGAFWADLASKALTTVISKIKEFAKSAIDAGDRIGTMADIYSLTTDRLQEMEYAGIRLDVSLDTMTGSLTKLTRNMNSARAGSKLQTEAFNKLGIEITNADGSLRSANTVFGEAIDALGKVRSETERDAIAMQLFGKSAMDLNPLIVAGSDELEKLSDEAHKMGAVMSEEAVAALDDFDETIEQAKMSARAFVGEALAGIIGDGKTAAETMTDLQDSLTDNGSVQTLIDRYKSLSAELSSGSLSAEEAKQKNAELEQVKQDLIKVSGGVITALDLENGAFDDQVKALEGATQAERDYLKYKLTAQILENSGAESAKKIAAAKDKYKKSQEALTRSTESLARAEEAVANGKEKAWHGGSYQSIIEFETAQIQFFKGEMADAAGELENLSESEMTAQNGIKMLIENGFMDATEACAAFGLSADELNAILSDTGNTAQSTIPAVNDLQMSIDALNLEYEAAKETVASTLDSIISGWDEVPPAVAVSAEQVIANLQSQMDWMTSYRDNLDALMSRQIPGVDTSALIASLSDGSTESAAILAGLRNATDDQVAQIAQSMAGVEQGKEAFVGSIAAAQIDYDERMAEMVDIAVESVKEMDLNDEAKSSALNTINGYINEIRANSGRLNLTMTRAAQDALNAWKRVFDEHSPSREMMKSGENAIKGAIIGVEEMQGELVKVYTALGEKLLDGLSVGMMNSSGKAMETVDDVAKELAQRIGDIANVFATSSDIADLQYKLWEMTNKDTTEKEKNTRQLESLNRQTAIQQSKIGSVSDAYHRMVELTGENSEESLKLQKQLLQEQINLEKLKDTIKELTTVKEAAYDTDKLSKMAEQEFKLWSLENQSASDSEKLAKQAELLALKYEMQGASVSDTEAALAEMVEQYGANSEESVKLQEQLLKEKIAYMELKKQIDEVNRARGFVGGKDIAPSGFMQAADIWAGMNTKATIDLSGINSIGKQDVGGMIAGAVNAITTMPQAPIVVQNPLYINGKELARATVSDFRAVEASSPQVRSDRL